MNSVIATEYFNYQAALNDIREEGQFDFAAIALPEDSSHSAVIKWKYASGNINNRYQLIVLRPVSYTHLTLPTTPYV